MKKSCSLGSTAQGTDRRRGCGKISGLFESGPAVEKGTYDQRHFFPKILLIHCYFLFEKNAYSYSFIPNVVLQRCCNLSQSGVRESFICSIMRSASE